MHSTRPIQWAEQPVQPRRKRIDTNLWSAHKDVILREFKDTHSIGHVRKYMRENYAFEAELHHYKYQIYTKWAKNLSEDLLRDSPQLPDVESSPEGNPGASTPQSKSATPKNIGVTRERSTVILGHGTKIRYTNPKSTSEQDKTRSDSVKRSALLCSDEVSPQKKQRSAHGAVTEGTVTEVSLPPNDSATVFSSNPSHNSYFCSSCGSRATASTAGTSVVSRAESRVESRGEHVKSWLDTAADDKDNLDPLGVDATQRPGKYKYNDMHKIRQAADLLMTMQSFDEAFQLYVLVWRYINNRILNGKEGSLCFMAMKQSAMIACARSARGPKHLCIAKKLLELELDASDPEEADGDVEYWKFLFNMLLEDIYRKLGDSTTASRHARTASELLPGFKSMVSRIASGKVTIDLLTRNYLERGYEYCEKYVFTTFDDFMHQDIGTAESYWTADTDQLVAVAVTAIPSEKSSRNHGSMSMHEFLEWCIIHLENATEVPAELVFLAPSSAVFYYLWRQMCEQPPGPCESRTQRMHSMMEMPVAVAEVLYAFCTTFMADGNERQKSEPTTRYEKTLFSAARRGAFKLKRLSNTELSALILTSFSQRDDETKKLQALSPLSIVQRVLDLDITCQEPEKISKCLAKELKNTYAKSTKHTASVGSTRTQPNVTYDPSIAPSNDSSSLGLMQEIAERMDRAGVAPAQDNLMYSKPMSTTSRQSRDTKGSMTSAMSQLSDHLGSVHLDDNNFYHHSTSDHCVAMEEIIDELYLRVQH